MWFRYYLKKIAELLTNSGAPDKTPQNAADELGLLMPVTLLGVIQTKMGLVDKKGHT